jgi:hypothetical protein
MYNIFKIRKDLHPADLYWGNIVDLYSWNACFEFRPGPQLFRPWVFSVPRGKCWEITSIKSRPLPNSFKFKVRQSFYH